MKNLYLVTTLIAVLFAACRSENAESVNQAGMTGIPDINALSEKIRENPDDPALYAARAQLFYENEGYDEALADLQKALSFDSSRAEYLHLMADVYLDYYKSAEALVTMEKAARLNPQNIPTLLKLSEFQLILKKHTEAMNTLEGIRAIDPLNPEMFYMAGAIFQDMGRIDEAINNYQSAVENDADLIDGWIALGKLWGQKNNPNAIFFFDNALRVDSTSITALHELAYYLSNVRNDLPASIAIYKRLIRMHPQYADAYYNSGLLYLDMDSVAQARRQFDLTVQIDPTFIQAYFYRGVTYEMEGDIEKARVDYETALRMNPEYDKPKEGLERLAQ